VKHQTVLVHLAAGVGNIVLVTPLLAVLNRNGFVVDVLIDADYAGTADLLRGWTAIRTTYEGTRCRPPPTGYTYVLPAIPPFYWSRHAASYVGARNTVQRPPDALFYRDEQAYNLRFADLVGCDTSEAPYYHLPGPRNIASMSPPTTIVVAPGSKPHEMTAKRWPFFPELAAELEDCVIVGTPQDLVRRDGSLMSFPSRARSLVGCLSLEDTARIIASAAAVVANDAGPGHMAGALGVPTILLFGPTPESNVGPPAAQRYSY
jgi:ADP-heptose:LPS heptosyltransferase